MVDQGLDRLRQQGLDRPARLRAAAARRRARLLRHLRRGARGPRRRRRSRSSRASPPATTCTASCSARARALFENGRGVADDHRARGRRRAPLGALIALFERAVGLYALAGRRQRLPPARGRGRQEGGRGGARRCRGRCWRRSPPSRATPPRIAAAAGAPGDVEAVFLLLEHLAASGRARVEGAGPAARFARR